MEKYKQIKKNHHYVWSFYLKSWAQGNNIYYISQKGKVAYDSIKGLAKETDFYKINLLNIEDINFIKRLSSKSPFYLQKIHMSHLKHFVKLLNISSVISQSKLDLQELDSINNVIYHNSLEDLHSAIEGLAVNIISDLAQGNSNSLNSNKNMIAFCVYLGHQISRTKAFKERCLTAIRTQKANPSNLKLWEKNWWFLSFMFGVNIGYDLYNSKDKDNHIFISNNTSQTFITSDSPIINIHSSLKILAEGEAPSYADFYIPLSPKYAYMINNSSDYNHLSNSINIHEVKKLNKLIFDNSHKIVFSNSASILEELKAYRKQISI